VQFHETDAAAIVHFSWYPRYMEEAEHALWRAAGLSIARPDSPYGFPRVAIACDYKRPLKFEEEFDTWIRIAAMTDRSIRYDCQILSGGATVAQLTMTIVCVTKGPDGTMRPSPLPDEVRARLEVYSHAVA
jgi:YbgC/YbaW family acyl-CoA thioester hydrolase